MKLGNSSSFNFIYITSLIYILFLPIFLISCKEELLRPKILLEKRDKNSKLIEQITTGYNPGEDKFLKILVFDSNGNLIKHSGIKDYGLKFKDVIKYDYKNRVIKKISYLFETRYDSFNSNDLYSLKDTIAVTTEKNVSSIEVYEYDELNKSMRKLKYENIYDSLIQFNRLIPVFDTTWKVDSNEIILP